MAARQSKKRASVDVGGTFTDCLVLDEKGELAKFKAPTTPKDPSDGFLRSLEKAAYAYGLDLRGFLGSVEMLIHGTTLATNTLLTGKGAKTGMITTRNFRDILELRRGMKPTDVSLYNVFIPPTRPLVPRKLRIGVEERTLYDGEIATPLNEADVAQAVATLRKDGVEAVAVCFMHSYKNPTNERRATEIVRRLAPEWYVTSSHETLPMWGEFERFNTTVVGAYVGPMVARYLAKLDARLKDEGFEGAMLMMLANGLVQPVEKCINRAVHLLDSGPAAAPAAAVHLGRLAGREDLLSIDMGGTSFDVCLIKSGEIPTTTESWHGGQRIAIKKVDIETLGAGGGSIAGIDSLGLLKVGPESAGADPGPACYGRGTLPTVTDADVLLGYIPHDYFLGGEIKLDPGLAKKAMSAVADAMKVDAIRAAEAIFKSVNAGMADKISEVSTKRGHDVRECVLVAGGGGGPTHAGFIAEMLGIPTVIIPSVAALFSAFGMFAMDLGEDYVRSFVARCASVDPEELNGLFEEMEQEARESFRAIGVPEKQLKLKRTADMRFVGQFHEVETEVPAGKLTRRHVDATVKAFMRKHEELFTFAMPWQPVEVLYLRLKAVAPRAPFRLREIAKGSSTPAAALKRRRNCRFNGKDIDTAVYDGDKIRAGNVLAGPAIVEESTMTVVVPKGFRCRVDAHKNYILTRQGR